MIPPADSQGMLERLRNVALVTSLISTSKGTYTSLRDSSPFLQNAEARISEYSVPILQNLQAKESVQKLQSSVSALDTYSGHQIDLLSGKVQTVLSHVDYVKNSYQVQRQALQTELQGQLQSLRDDPVSYGKQTLSQAGSVILAQPKVASAAQTVTKGYASLKEAEKAALAQVGSVNDRFKTSVRSLRNDPVNYGKETVTQAGSTLMAQPKVASAVRKVVEGYSSLKEAERATMEKVTAAKAQVEGSVKQVQQQTHSALDASLEYAEITLDMLLPEKEVNNKSSSVVDDSSVATKGSFMCRVKALGAKASRRINMKIAVGLQSLKLRSQAKVQAMKEHTVDLIAYAGTMKDTILSSSTSSVIASKCPAPVLATFTQVTEKSKALRLRLRAAIAKKATPMWNAVVDGYKYLDSRANLTAYLSWLPTSAFALKVLPLISSSSSLNTTSPSIQETDPSMKPTIVVTSSKVAVEISSSLDDALSSELPATEPRPVDSKMDLLETHLEEDLADIDFSQIEAALRAEDEEIEAEHDEEDAEMDSLAQEASSEDEDEPEMDNLAHEVASEGEDEDELVCLDQSDVAPELVDDETFVEEVEEEEEEEEEE